MIRLHERYVSSDGSPAKGTVSVKPRWGYSYRNRTIANEWMTYELDGKGMVDIGIEPHDDTDPTPIWYLVIENVPGCGLRQMAFCLPARIPDGTILRIGDYRGMSIYSTPPEYKVLGDRDFYGYGHNPGVDEYAAGGIRAGLQPAVGEARFMAGHVQVWDGNEWVNQSPRTGDEYTDLATGEVFAINP